MDREELRDVLVSLLEEEMGESYELRDDDMDLREGLGLDSVDIVGLIMRVEREFRIRLMMEDLMEVKLVGQLLDLIWSNVNSKEVEVLSSSSDRDNAEAA